MDEIKDHGDCNTAAFSLMANRSFQSGVAVDYNHPLLRARGVAFIRFIKCSLNHVLEIVLNARPDVSEMLRATFQTQQTRLDATQPVIKSRSTNAHDDREGLRARARELVALREELVAYEADLAQARVSHAREDIRQQDDGHV